MSKEDIIEKQKEHLINVLGKKLYDSEETCGKNSYRDLARKYWPEEFKHDSWNYSVVKEVHHINGDHYDNRLCNLVVLTSKEHREIHALFFKKEGLN